MPTAPTPFRATHFSGAIRTIIKNNNFGTPEAFEVQSINMSGLKFYSYQGMGQELLRDFGYAQAVRVGDRIESRSVVKVRESRRYDLGFSFNANFFSGGWSDSLEDLPTDAAAQIDNAFENIDRALKAAGGKGWSQVFRVNSTHLPLNADAMAAVQRNFKKYMPEHQPIWSAVGVQRFGADRMAVEIEVVAYDPEGAKVEASK